jgi:hypothetical protein
MRALLGCLVFLSCLGGCAFGNESRDAEWTVQQAESITSIRGLTVRVRNCRGIDGHQGGGRKWRFQRFACVAGARAEFDRYDTVGILYVLHPLEDYDGVSSRHRLTDVRFLGGPGIP